MLLAAGSLVARQAVLNSLRRDLEDPDASVSLNTVEYPFDAAHYIGDISVRVQCEHPEMIEKSDVNVEASFIPGGQIGLSELEICLIYLQENHIPASVATPYLHIGETRYGKPIPDRILTPLILLDDAARCALISADSTIRSNISVGPPPQLIICRSGSLVIDTQMLLKPGSVLYRKLPKSCITGLRHVFDRLPRFDWED